MGSVSRETEAYFMDMSLHRCLDFLVRTWGARPVWSVDLVEDNKRNRAMVATVKLVNLVEQLELSHPPAAVYSVRYTPSYIIELHVKQTLWKWHRGVYEHQLEVN